MTDSTDNLHDLQKRIAELKADTQPAPAPESSAAETPEDKQHRDRLVMGLGLSGDAAPFLSIINEKGEKQDIFGTY